VNLFGNLKQATVENALKFGKITWCVFVAIFDRSKVIVAFKHLAFKNFFFNYCDFVSIKK